MELTNRTDKRVARRKGGNMDVATLMYGKVPPQAKEMEDMILGIIMLEARTIDEVTDLIKDPRIFYVESNQRIFRAMLLLRSEGVNADLISVVNKLKELEELDVVGGPYYVSKLTNAVMGSANLKHYCMVVIQQFIKREMIRISGEIIGDAYEDSTDCFELLDVAQKGMYGLTFQNFKVDYNHIEEGMIDVVKRIEFLMHKDDEMPGIPSGFIDLDRITGGWQEPDFIILAARPSVGKTALAWNFARNAARSKNFIKEKKGVGFFSLEMSRAQIIQRAISCESEIPLQKVTRGRLDEVELKKLFDTGIKPVANMKIFIDDTSGLNIYELRAKARKMKEKDNVGLIIIDYIQLMQGVDEGKRDNREQEISKISRDLKGLCKELHIPIIALSQLSRDVEKRGGKVKMPVLSDLRESGAIEQDADMVMFVYRPEYYDIHANDKGESTFGETHVKISKHRNGQLDLIKLKANLSIQKFVDFGKDDAKINDEPDPFPVDKPFKPKPTNGKLYIPGEDKKDDDENEEKEYKF